MNVTLPKKEKMKKRTIIIYIVAIIICIVAIAIVIGVEVLGDRTVDEFFGLSRIAHRTEEEESELKSNFESIFDNQLTATEEFSVNKIENSKEIIYTRYQKEEKEEKYEINVNLPYINIRNSDARDFNNKIISTFEAKVEDIIKNTKTNSIYTVKYKANIENNILSLIIYSDLKQDSNPQRVIIKTFNYNLQTNSEIELEDAIKKYDLNKSEVQFKVDEDIKELQRRDDELRNLGYNVFSRDTNGSIYKVNNIEEFFIYNGNIYIIFAYGNSEATSQKDIVII